MKKKEINNISTNKRSLIDLITSACIHLIWIGLFVFAMISASDPDWLKKLSEDEKKYETGLMINKGLEHSRNREMLLAIEEFKKALDILPDNVPATVNMGVVYKNSKKYKEALSTFKHALTLHPLDSSNIYDNMTDIYIITGNKEKTIECFNNALQATKCNIDKFMKDGIFHMNNKEWAKAVISFKTSVRQRMELKSYFEEMLYLSLRKYDENAKYKKSILRLLKNNQYNKHLPKFDLTCFRLNLSQDKGLAVNYNKLGYCIAKTGSLNEAEKYFNKAIEIWEDYPDALTNLRYISENRQTQ